MLEVIDDAPWCTNQHVHAVFDMHALFVVVRSAVGDAEFEASVFSQRLAVFKDLNGQLSGWRQYHGSDRILLGRLFAFLIQQAVKTGNQEGRGFTGTRLCLAAYVFAAQSDGQCHGLNRGAKFEPEGFNAFFYVSMDVQVLKFGVA